MHSDKLEVTEIVLFCNWCLIDDHYGMYLPEDLVLLSHSSLNSEVTY